MVDVYALFLILGIHYTSCMWRLVYIHYFLFLFYIKSCIYRWRLVYVHYFFNNFTLKVVFIGGEWT